MKKSFDRHNQKVRRLCQDISHRADDPKKLQTLVIQLQQALVKDRYETSAVKMTAQRDNPFDKIMVG
ncbi:MAG TPA: hypothetical protein VN911_15010 [Candidatus Acidoferrum sp.]|nr:hypothetical protein [Candidatus Acidoferrum sp.]